MARDTDKRATSFETENTGGLLSGFLAEEDVFDRRALWRLGAWGVASVGAVVLAVYVNQSSIAMRREQVAAADLARQAEQIQRVAKESQGEARRLASAVETLNGDRDRLYSRVTVLEQGLETVTGAIAKQHAAAISPPPAPAPPAASTAATAASDPPPAQKQPQAQGPAPAPAVSPVATTAPKPADKPVEKPSPVAAAAEPAPAAVASIAQKPSNPPAATTPPAAAATPASVTTAITTTAAITPAPPLVAAKSMMGPPDPAATKLIEPEKPATPEKLEKSEKLEKPEKPEKAEKTDKPEKSDKPAKTITGTPMPDVMALAPSADDAESDAAKSLPKLPVQRTEFGVDVGGANSVGGLRALWRGLLKSRSNAALTTLRPIIVIREGSNGLGMQLRLVAGPLDDAAAAAKICAGLIANDRPCTTTVFDGQRLMVNADESADPDKPAGDKTVAAKPPTSRYYAHRRGFPKRVVAVEEPAKKPDPPSALSSFFRRQNPQ
jgi:hypothetical protein